MTEIREQQIDAETTAVDLQRPHAYVPQEDSRVGQLLLFLPGDSASPPPPGPAPVDGKPDGFTAADLDPDAATLVSINRDHTGPEEPYSYYNIVYTKATRQPSWPGPNPNLGRYYYCASKLITDSEALYQQVWLSSLFGSEAVANFFERGIEENIRTVVIPKPTGETEEYYKFYALNMYHLAVEHEENLAPSLQVSLNGVGMPSLGSTEMQVSNMQPCDLGVFNSFYGNMTGSEFKIVGTTPHWDTSKYGAEIRCGLYVVGAYPAVGNPSNIVFDGFAHTNPYWFTTPPDGMYEMGFSGPPADPYDFIMYFYMLDFAKRLGWSIYVDQIARDIRLDFFRSGGRIDVENDPYSPLLLKEGDVLTVSAVYN